MAEIIPVEVANLEDVASDLPKQVAELPAEMEAPEATPYIISFEKYKEKLCEVSLLSSNKARKAIEVLKKIGMNVKSRADFQRYSIDRIPVIDKGDYKKLYNGLSPDIEIREIKLQQDARIFYFDIESEKKLYIVAITENHYETDKNR